MTNDILTHSQLFFTTPPHILLVEDNAIVILATKLLLKRLRCEIDIAVNGKEAIEKASCGNYQLIFMDINLPDISGIAATQAIRALTDTSKAQTPIVGLTARQEDVYTECLAADMNTVLCKPASLETLKLTIQQYIETV